MAIYQRDPAHPHEYFTVSLDADGTFDLVEDGKTRGQGAPSAEWKVAENHLQEVVDHPQEYIDHPARLDLDWLRTRLGGPA